VKFFQIQLFEFVVRCLRVAKIWHIAPYHRTISQLGSSALGKKGKAVPLQAWEGPEGSRKLRFPDFRDNGTGWW